MASITKRGENSYYIIVSLGFDVNGKNIRKTITYKPDLALLTKKTPQAREKELEEMVKQYAADFERKCRNGDDPGGRFLTLASFIERWLVDYAATKLEQTTLEGYKLQINNHILPVLGHMKLVDIKPATVTSFYASLARDGARLDDKPGGYALTTIKRIAAILSSILSAAERWEIIDRNPCSKADLPTNIDTGDSIKFFTPEQATAFLAYLDQPYTVNYTGHIRNKGKQNEYSVRAYSETHAVPLQTKIMMHLGVNSGCRKGELLALQWPDIDFDAQTISITKAVAVVNRKQIIKKPKTKSSIRKIYISQNIVSMLQQLKAWQFEQKVKYKDYWADEQWVFTQDNGTCMHYSTPYQSLQQILERYNADRPEEEQLPLIPFHGLRHTSATAQIANGVDIVTVATRLGHASPSITTSIYAHPLSENDKNAADTLDKLFKSVDSAS